MKDYRTFISVQDLGKHIDNPGWVIVDCRFDLADPNWGYRAYIETHIPGALFADLDKDLSGIKTNEKGRHPLPDETEFIKKLGEWGITTDKQVVVYDSVSGAFASRLWCLLRAFGHEKVAVLDGGIQKWIHEGFTLKNGQEKAIPVNFDGNNEPDMFVTAKDLNDYPEEFLLIDSRAPDRYMGINEPIDPVAGHIPGSVNYFYQDNIAQSGQLRPESALQDLLDFVNTNNPEKKKVVFYCGSGVTSCLNFLVLFHLGKENVYLYPGSWSEWIRDPDRPVE